MPELERVQRRATSIICTSLSYQDALKAMNIKELVMHYDDIVNSLNADTTSWPQPYITYFPVY